MKMVAFSCYDICHEIKLAHNSFIRIAISVFMQSQPAGMVCFLMDPNEIKVVGNNLIFAISVFMRSRPAGPWAKQEASPVRASCFAPDWLFSFFWLFSHGSLMKSRW